MPELLLFILALILVFTNGFITTTLFEKNFNYKLIPIYLVSGIIATTLLVYSVRIINLPFWIVTAISILLIVWQKKKINFPKINIKKTIPIFVFILICTITLSWIGFNQGYKNGNLVFYNENAHDGLWHIALQNSLITSIPPENPIYSREVLKGYHYFADLFWAYLSAVSGVKAEMVYTIFLPFFLVGLFSISTLALFRFLIKDQKLAYLISTILILGSGFSFLVPFFFPGGSNNQSTFWLDQPVGYIVNPHLLLSFSIVNILILMFLDGMNKWKILFGILLGSLMVIKVYAFLVLAPVFGVVAIYEVLKRKNYDLLIGCIIAGVLAMILVLTSRVSNGFPFIFEPGWFIKTMFEASDHLNYPQWEMQRQIFAQHHNYLRLAWHWFYGVMLFILGNFGLKVIGLVFIPVLLFKKASEIDKKTILLCLGLILVSFSLPLLFLQKGVVWSSIQFLHFAQLPLCLLIFLVIKNLKKKIQYLILLIILLLGLPTTTLAFVKTLDQSNYKIYSEDLIFSLKQLKQIAKNHDVWIIGEIRNSSLVPAISGHSVYYADPNMLGILQIDAREREKKLNQIENFSLCPLDNILITIPESTASGKIIYQNRKAKILKC